MQRFEFLTITAIALILAVSFQYASAIRCYECNSQDVGCGDPFRKDVVAPSLFRQCPPAYSGERFCVKAKSSKTNTVHRYCSNQTIDRTVPIETFSCKITTVYTTGNSGQFQVDVSDICTACYDGDGCNGASKFVPIAVMIAIPLAIIKILAF